MIKAKFTISKNSPTITTSSLQSTISPGPTIFSGKSAFKPFKPITDHIQPKITAETFNNLIIKRHLDDLLEKSSQAKRLSIRRCKSTSCINTKELLKFDKMQTSKSMININIKTTVKAFSKDQQNILFVNNHTSSPKSLNENFKPRNYSSTTTSTATTTETSSAIGTSIISKMSSMLKFPCSLSLFDLIILILRFKDTCSSLIKLLMPHGIEKVDSRFFESKFQTVLGVYKVRILNKNFLMSLLKINYFPRQYFN